MPVVKKDKNAEKPSRVRRTITKSNYPALGKVIRDKTLYTAYSFVYEFVAR